MDENNQYGMAMTKPLPYGCIITVVQFQKIFDLKRKKIIPLYPEALHFLITRAEWLVTHIYGHFTFEQSMFKKDFVVMNKLLNNCNFGIDCRNNCVLEPLFDDFEEISYIKKFTTIFNDETFRDFYSPSLLKEEII